MAETYRLRYDGLSTTLGAAISSTGATSITFAAALQTMGSNIPTLTTDQYLVLVIDNEIIHLTAYTSGATSGTISRGKESTTAATHSNGATVLHAPTVQDFGSLTPGDGYVGAKVTRSAAYSLVNAATTAFPFDAEEFDSDGFHDNTTNNTRLTVPTGRAGKYLVQGSVSALNNWSANRFIARLTKNGTDIKGGAQEFGGSSASGFPGSNVAVIVDLAVGDYVELTYYQDSGSTRSADTSICGFSATLITGAGGTGATTVGGRTRVVASNAQSFAHGTATAVLWPTETFDDLDAHDTVTNTSRFTAPTTDRYRLVSQVAFLSIGTNAFSIRKNGAGVMIAYDFPHNSSNAQEIQTVDSGWVDLTAGDYLEVMVNQFQFTGTAAQVFDTGNLIPWAVFERAGSGGSGGGDSVTAVKTANYTASSGEFVPCNAAGGGFMVTLPAATAGRYVTVVKTDSSANVVTVVGASGATINGDSAGYIVSQYTAVTLVADGTNWVVKSAYGEGTASDQIWTTVADLPLTTLTGWTTGTGSWSASASGIQQATSSASRKGLFFDTQFDQADCIVEAEIKIDTSTSTVNGRCGFLFDGPPADTSGGTTVLLVTSGSLVVVSQLYFEQDQVLAGPTMTLASTFATGVWKKFRVHKSGRQFTAYVDGVLAGQAYVPVSPDAPRQTKRLMLYSYETDCSWRNLKVWTARLPT